ncbi:MAG: hypothetical protein PWQ73_657 [Petrotoga sp.]|nr:hypothetical protein [Petrotoga sp.]
MGADRGERVNPSLSLKGGEQGEGALNQFLELFKTFISGG